MYKKFGGVTIRYFKSPINYIGNKYKLLKQIIPMFPKGINTFVDLFGGSGTVLLNVDAKRYLYNDINIYVKEILQGIIEENIYQIIDTINYYIHAYDLSKTNEEGFKQFRDYYNSRNNDWKVLYTLMCYSFNYQFRFNNEHLYNSSFGRNRSHFSKNQEKNLIEVNKKMKYMNIEFFSMSFDNFNFNLLGENDFIYLDPPYFNSVGNYNDGKRGFEGWTIEHENKLRYVLSLLDEKGIKFALSNNIETNCSLKDYALKKGFNINYLANTYNNSNYQKKSRNDDIEVLITNY